VPDRDSTISPQRQNAYPIDRMVATCTRAVYCLTDSPHESHRMRIRLTRKLSHLLDGASPEGGDAARRTGKPRQ
jgi:hypothetical protein